jgi:hypothetical protein
LATLSGSPSRTADAAEIVPPDFRAGAISEDAVILLRMNAKTYVVSGVCVAALLLIGALPVVAKERKSKTNSSTSNPSPTAGPVQTKTPTSLSRKKGEQPKELTQVNTAPPKSKVIADIKDKPAPKATATASPKVKTYDFTDPEVYTRTRR